MLHLVAIFSLIHQVWTFNWPAPTDPTANDFAIDGWSPKPTPHEGLKEKRQEPNPTICGYVDGIASLSLDCGAGHPCGYNTEYDFFACCASESFVGTTVQPAECPQPLTECIPYVSVSDCVGDCANNPFILQCTNTNSPYCVIGTLVDSDFSGFAAIGCGTTPVTAPVYLTPTSGGSNAITSSVIVTESPTPIFSPSPATTPSTSSTKTTNSGVSTVTPKSSTKTTTQPSTTSTPSPKSGQAAPRSFPLGLGIAGCAVAFLNVI